MALYLVNPNLPFELSAIVLVVLALWGRKALPKV
jgi:hypothetical protein